VRRSPLLLVAACLLAACTVGPPSAVAPSGAPGEAPAESPATPSRPDAPDAPAAGDDPTDSAPAVPGAAACDDDDVVAMDAQVAGQLDAIADRDWGTALGFATSAFRADYDDERFAAVISDGFPVVAANASHRSDGCVRSRDAAQLLVTVTATDGATSDLVYLMDLEDGTWRIGGAVPHGAGADDPDTQVA